MFISDEELQDGDIRPILKQYLNSMGFWLPRPDDSRFWTEFRYVLHALKDYEQRELAELLEYGVQ